jgi:hypothetical protein
VERPTQGRFRGLLASYLYHGDERNRASGQREPTAADRYDIVRRASASRVEPEAKST